MRQNILLASVALAFLLTGCSQSASRVPVYKYTGQNSGAGSLGIHTLRSGDTLWSIANAYHVDLRDMLDLNHLSAPYALHTGQRIKIPAPITYTAHKGDTLYKVSRMFDTTTTELARLNTLRAPYVLKAGQSIRLPSRHSNDAPTIKSAPVQVAEAVNYTPQTISPIQREELAPSATTTQTLPKTETASVKETPPKKSIEAVPLTRSSKGFLKPVSGKIISGFGTKADGLHNDGVNIKATRGDAVRAAEQGVVVYSGQQIEGYGNLVLIRHADGFMTAYAHMDKILVKKGEILKRGQTIGTVGATGHVDSPQLHFEIRKGKDAINPTPYIG